ncbi:unnamed protein product [Rotaria socialis]|uniref:Uncharacterized protein n=1 Tax=Rotaria socialis TaxID=392032 RepID=A0A821LSC8_9BILA|nr:unnamed protein product [Rotaria socialis]CAF4754951.1 unnamed protein product [Rotaria socialis]
MNTIDFEECLKDSPAYRNQLRQAVNHIDMLEDRLEQMFKMCNSVINNGKIFVQEFQKFLKSIFDARELFSTDEVAYKSLGKFGNYLREIQTLFSNLLEQTSHSLLRTLTRMLKEDIKKVKDQGKLFDRLSSDYDIALQKNADASKAKPHLCEDASKILTATRSCFGHTSIDYTYQINVLYNQHKVDLIELFLSYINFHKAFFHQGYELLSIDTEQDFNSITTELTRMRQENAQKQKILEKVHDTNQRRSSTPGDTTTCFPIKSILSSSSHYARQLKYDDNRNDGISTDASLSVAKETLSRNPSQQSLSNITNTLTNGIEATKEGYLFKRSHNKFKTWNRRWFSIRNGQLLYMKRNSGNSINDNSQQQSSYSVMILDLRLCTIRASNDHDRRFVFEIISPNSTHLLQADSQIECDHWVNSLQLAISNLFKSPNNGNLHSFTLLPKPYVDDRSNSVLTAKNEIKQEMIKDKIDFVRSITGNDKCSDCDADGPEWASINLGILLCLNCCGAHRGLGVSLSKVRSLHMDTWDLETLIVMGELGNTVVNSIYEANLSNNVKKPSAETDALTRRSYIEAKYVQKAFLRSLPASNQIRSTTRTIKRWSVMKGPISTATLTNEHDDDGTSNSLKVNSRQLLTRRLTGVLENELTADSLSSIWNANIYLYEGARHRSVPTMLHALTLGADKNFLNEHDHGRTPLIQTILSRSVAAAEFLLINNAKINLADEDGKTPLHYATQLANKGRGPIILLLKRGADPLVKDRTGIDACSLSMAIGDPDVITWYRLIALHEQMKEEDADAEKTYISILDDPVYMKEIARTPSFS